MSSGPGLYVHYHSDADPDPMKVHQYVDLSPDQDGGPAGGLFKAGIVIQEYLDQHGSLDLLKLEWVPKIYTEEEAKQVFGLGFTHLFADAGNPRVTHSTLAQGDLPDGNGTNGI